MLLGESQMRLPGCPIKSEFQIHSKSSSSISIPRAISGTYFY